VAYGKSEREQEREEDARRKRKELKKSLREIMKRKFFSCKPHNLLRERRKERKELFSLPCYYIFWQRAYTHTKSEVKIIAAERKEKQNGKSSTRESSKYSPNLKHPIKYC
jgi:hypothetical protein